MTLPMLVLYAVSTLGPFITRDLGIEAGLLGYFIMSSFGLAAVLSPWAGAFVDRTGSRRAVVILFGAMAAAFGLIATVPHFPGLIAAIAVCGIAQALANPVTNLLIAQRIPPAKKAAAVGLKQAGVQVAALFAGLALPGIATAFGWRAAFGLIAPVAVVLAVCAPLLAPGGHTPRGVGFRLARPNRLLGLLIAVQFSVGVSLSGFVTFLPSFATHQGMPPAQAGLMVAVFGATGILSRILLTPLSARLPDESPLLATLIALAAFSIMVTLFASPTSQWRLWAGAVGVGFTAVATNAIAMGMLVRDTASFGSVASASGLVSAAFFAGFAVGPPGYGAIVESPGGYTAAWSALIGVLLFGCALALALQAVRRGHNARLTMAPSRGNEWRAASSPAKARD